VSTFEQSFLKLINAQHPEIAQNMQTQGMLSKESEQALLAVLPEFVNNFLLKHAGAA
jgi:F0F1-type ATP synthase alpha subunit